MDRTSLTGTTLSCCWCGVSLANAWQVTYLNGNLPCCDLCLLRAKQGHPYNCNATYMECEDEVFTDK
ncbi:MAG: hypothetical protein WA066_02815 [Candidatus Omnitrophota bacterium]